MANLYWQSRDNTTTSPLQKLRLAVLAGVLVVIGGTVGLMWLEELSVLKALYMVIITLSTVGFGEVIQLHDASRIFVMGLIVIGVMMGGFLVTIVGQWSWKDSLERLLQVGR